MKTAKKIDKVVVTNAAALEAKYGKAYAKVEQALNKLVAADAKRGLTTQVVAIDDQKAMKPFGANAVGSATAHRAAKVAVDAIAQSATPDYIVILGAIDVVPHQPLKNPAYSPPDGDTDAEAFSDLPYACDAPYSTDVKDFISPTRVVGRIPDLVGATDPAYLLGLLDAAARWAPADRDDYEDYFGLSAWEWRSSTRSSLQAAFGSGRHLHTSPPRGPGWPARLLARRMHFINCHGGDTDPHFYGQRGSKYPVAHESPRLGGKVTAGTVVAAECCYGAQLYDPSLAEDGAAGIANTYLGNGAHAFLGSTTIAYGPSEGTANADLICLYFARNVLAGASTGRAALEARQEFVRQSTVVDPMDLKTLAQFVLLGDPSIQPVATPAVRGATATAKAAAAGASAERGLRRRNLAATGLAIGRASSVASRPVTRAAKPSVRAQLSRLLADSSVKQSRVLSFAVDEPAGSKRASVAPARAATVHVVVGKVNAKAAPAAQLVAVVAREEAGTIVSYRRLYSR